MTQYVIYTRVAKLEPEWTIASGRKEGDNIILEREFRGWYVLFEGSRESLYLGKEQPDLKEGQRVKITIAPEEG